MYLHPSHYLIFLLYPKNFVLGLLEGRHSNCLVSPSVGYDLHRETVSSAVRLHRHISLERCYVVAV